jgi:hypothetical protein
MLMADRVHFSLRFNYDKPEHRRVIEALEDIDRTKYTSKTHFIICALEHYIGYLSQDGESGESKKRGDVVTHRELEKALDTAKAEIKSEVYEKLLHCISLGGAQVQPVRARDDKDQVETSGDLADELSKYAGIMDSVMSWSED